MKKDRIILIGFLVVVMICSFVLGEYVSSGRVQASYSCDSYSSSEIENISIEDYRQLLADQETCIVLISRITCKYCAIVDYLIPQCNDGRIKIYCMDLEPYHNTNMYDSVKNELGISYVPTFFYLKDGEVSYTMNNPVNDDYFAEGITGEKQAEIRNDTVDKINSFIDGAIGIGPVINEELQQEIITAQPAQ